MKKRQKSVPTPDRGPGPDSTPAPDPEPIPLQLDPHIENVHALAELHARSEQAVDRHQRRIETLTAALGRPRTLYGLLTGVGLWVGYNSVAPALALPRLDPPPFFWLQGLVGLLALLMTTVVLITQNRQGKMAARRGLLDLHVNLLSEQKVAKLIALLEELRRDLPSVGNRHDAQAEYMSRPVDPQTTIAKLEESIEQAISAQSGPPTEAELREGLSARMAEVVREADAAGPPEED
jgi:uncharacterized membrane protein